MTPLCEHAEPDHGKKIMITTHDRRFILASGSPRRRELTSALGLEPIVLVSSVPEERTPGESPQGYTERLALDKAEAVAQSITHRDDLPDYILAADTIVVLGHEVLEKPVDAEDACAMLMDLSGSTHEVITSFCWLERRTHTHRVCSVSTSVTFRAIGAGAIARYVATGEPMDKAGAYGIQGLAGAFVERIEGSYSAVVGLPVSAVIHELEAMGGLDEFPFSPNMA